MINIIEQVKQENKDVSKTFDKIEISDIFQMEENGRFYLRIANVINSKKKAQFNCVCILTGVMYFFQNGASVYAIFNAGVVLDEKI